MQSDEPSWSQALVEAARERASALDPTMQRVRGIVHTPAAVAGWMAGEVDRCVRASLDGSKGLGDERVVVVDPACGPGIFLAAVHDCARETGRPRGVIGIDVDENAVAVARKVLGPRFESSGWPLDLRVADALDALPDSTHEDDAFAVVLGNPPWRSGGVQAGLLVRDLMAEFNVDARGEPLRERKSGVLSDAYVHFFRWGAEVVRRAPSGGVLAFVTNSSFVDGPVHRGMRAALLRWFDEVRVLDLGGTALVARAGDVDENVFGVRPAAVITLAARRVPFRGEGQVRWAGVRGTRRSKLDRLQTRELPAFAEVDVQAPAFVFRPMRPATVDVSEWATLASVMPFHREGVQTNRDAMVVDVSRDRLVKRLHAFVRGERAPDLDVAMRALAHYDPTVARERVGAALEADPDGTTGAVARRIAWRPFDYRWFAPIAPLCHRPRPDLLSAIDDRSLVLLTVRKDRGERPWSHASVVRHIPDNCYFSARSSCRTRAFPARTPHGAPNLDRQALVGWPGALADDVDVEAILLYALGLFSSPSYVAACGDALRLDYPCLPTPPSSGAFESVVGAAKGLADVLLASDREEDPEVAPVFVGHHGVRSAALTDRIAQIDDEVRRAFAFPST